jgi:phytoene dehydrogenase-like protein
MTKEISICIIGAGIAGLAAGIYGQLNGFATQIFEKHTLPGGLCTAWKRQGYWFDGCIRYLYGSGLGQWLYPVMKQVGAVGERQFIHHEIISCVETRSGTQVTFYADIDRLEQHLLEVATQDAAHIRTLTRAVRQFARAQLPVEPPQNLGGLLREVPRMVRYLPPMARWGKVSFGQFIAGFTSPDLREAFTHYYNYADLPDVPVMFPMMDIGQHANRNAGVPQGGSLALARDMEQRYQELGGQIQYRAPVERILVDARPTGGRASARAVGIRLADGTEHRADVVLSAADAHTTLYHMLGEQYISPAYQEAFLQQKVVPPIVQVSLGVARTFEGVPHILNVGLQDPVIIAGEAHHRLSLNHYGYDPTLSPVGKTSVVVVYETGYGPWEALAADRAAYEAEKERIAEQVVDRLEARFPGLRERVEVLDVATPLTTERYTGNWQGSPQGWQTTVQNVNHNLPCKLDHLERFYIAGQWVQLGGGVPGGVISGRGAIQQLCRDLGRPFAVGL